MKIAPPILLNPDDFKIGFKVIDDQHAEIVNCINELYMMRFNGEVSIRPIVTRLKKHINIHFNFEESLMLHCNYPGYDQHKQEHQILNEKAMCLIRKFNNKEEVSEDIQNLLIELLITHVNKSDRIAMNYCYNHGLLNKD